MKSYFVYSNNYDFSFLGLDKLHPFDAKKFSRAWNLLTKEYQPNIDFEWVEPTNGVSTSDLLRVHTQQYLDSLSNSSTIANIIEIFPARFVPNFLLNKGLVGPIKLACQGTLIASELAVNNNAISLNFGGGYHHAFRDRGEGFCIFADAFLAIDKLRENALLKQSDEILMIDLDAHRGNGFESFISNDSNIHNFDMYNLRAYPGIHFGDPDEFPYMVPLQPGMSDNRYFEVLDDHLTRFLESAETPKLAFYNAGNDILDIDPLGGLSVSYEGVLRRDKLVIEQLLKRQIPTVVMTSGGYSPRSFEIIAELAKSIIRFTN